jgi:hypothetical protein
MMHDT